MKYQREKATRDKDLECCYPSRLSLLYLSSIGSVVLWENEAGLLNVSRAGGKEASLLFATPSSSLYSLAFHGKVCLPVPLYSSPFPVAERCLTMCLIDPAVP